MSENQTDISVFTVTLHSIQISLRFSCSIVIEYEGKPLTDIATSENNQYIFNSEITLRQKFQKSHIDLVLQIITEKRGKFVGGVIRISCDDMKRMLGEQVIVGLLNCLDTNAMCELCVERIHTEKISLPLNFSYEEGRKRVKSPNKSQQFFGSKLVTKQSIQIFNGAIVTHSQNLQRPMSPSFKSLNLEKNLQPNFEQLKRKYWQSVQNLKAETKKRIQLENNQNDYKLEILKLKKKSQANDRVLAQKSSKIKDITISANSLKQKQLELQTINEQKNSLTQKLSISEKMIDTLGEELNEIKQLHLEALTEQKKKIAQINEVMALSQKQFNLKQEQMKTEIKNIFKKLNEKEQQYAFMKSENDKKIIIIDQLKNLFEQQKEGEEKKYIEFIEQGKKNLHAKQVELNEMTKKNQQLQRLLEKNICSFQKISQTLEKAKNQKQISLKQNSILEKQLDSLSSLKQKYSQLLRLHNLLDQDKKILENQLLKTKNSKEKSLLQYKNQFQDKIAQEKQIYKIIQQKYKQSQERNLKIQSNIDKKQNQIEKLKRKSENIMKEFKQLKEKYQKVLLQNDEKQSQNQLLREQKINLNLSTPNKRQIKLEQKLSQAQSEIAQLAIKIETQKIKFVEKNQQKAYLEEQILKLKLQIQNQDRIIHDKNEEILQEKKTQQEKEKQNKIAIMNYTSEIKGFKEKQIILQERIKIFQIQLMKKQQEKEKTQQKINKLQKKILNQSQILEEKQKEFDHILSLKKEGQKNIHLKEDQINQLKTNQLITFSEKENKEKMRKILEGNINELKHEVGLKDTMIKEKEIEISELKEQLKNTNQNLQKQKQKCQKNQKKLDNNSYELKQVKELLKRNSQESNQKSNEIRELQGEFEKVKNELTNKLKENKTSLQEKEKALKLLEQICEQFIKINSQEQIIEFKNKWMEKIKIEVAKNIGKKLINYKQTILRSDQQLQNKIIFLQRQVLEKEKTLENYSTKIQDEKKQREYSRQQIQTLKQAISQNIEEKDIKEGEIHRLMKVLEEKNQQIEKVVSQNQHLNEIVNEKKEYISEISGKLFVLQNTLDKRDKQNQKKINIIQQEWSSRYESICQDYIRKIDMIKAEKQTLQKQAMEKQKQLTKKLGQFKGSNDTERKNHENLLRQTIQKLQQQKLKILSTKNNQIEKLTHENKLLSDKNSLKEGENRKLMNQFEIIKGNLTKITIKKNELEQKLSQQTKAYQAELKNAKAREKSQKIVKQQSGKIHESLQKQIHKLMQMWTNKINMGLKVDRETNIKMIENVKYLEQKLIAAVRTVMQNGR